MSFKSWLIDGVLILIRFLFFKMFKDVEIPKGVSFEDVLDRSRYMTFVKDGSAIKKLVIFDVVVAFLMLFALVMVNIFIGFHFGVLFRALLMGFSFFIFFYVFYLLRTIFYFSLVKSEFLRQAKMATPKHNG